MKTIDITDQGYEELLAYMKENNIKDNNLRITEEGQNCKGVMFNIENGKKELNDIVEKVGDINFIIDQELLNEYLGFIFLSNKESNGNGFDLIPLSSPEEESGCQSCKGC